MRTVKIISIFVLLVNVCTVSVSAQSIQSLSSPDKNTRIVFGINRDKQAWYSVYYNNVIVLKQSRLGLVTDDADYSKRLKLMKSSPQEVVSDHYQLFTGKKTSINYLANKKVFHLQNKERKPLDIIFQVSNGGVAFRYYLPAASTRITTIKEEVTSFHFDTTTRAFLQPMQVAKSGWNQSNPAYEEHYKQNIPVTQPSTYGVGWVFPALFHYKDAWMLISEASLDTSYCGSRLQSESPTGEYRLGFPDSREVFTGGGHLPHAKGPLYSPWRIIAVGDLKAIAESTLGTDLAEPAIKMDYSFIKPGQSSWSWIMSKDDSIVFSEQIRYIDFASKMNWRYCLVDAAWDQKIGYDKVRELSNYADSKNVGLLVWYNSSGDWNTVPYSPKSKLLTHDQRVKEFNRLKEMGIKGVKIDFFGGDGQSMIKYYIDILNDAAQAKLLVNFHGATLPRGWARTYPHLLTMEAIKGFEMVTFNQADADAEANHCAMLPFTRNAFDPMDFTPMNLYRIPTRVKRKTSSAFELATSVLFLSGIQHFAESPAGMEHVPVYVQDYLKQVPASWDDVKFIDGFPGQYVVIARKAGNKWYIAGINGGKEEKTIQVDLASFNKTSGTLIADGADTLSFSKELINTADSKSIALKPAGGFVLVLE